MLPALFLLASLVNEVRSLIARQDLPAADRTVRAYQAQSGATPELAAAVSWLARAELQAGHIDRAERYAVESRALSDALLPTHKLDADPWLPTALGAAIEVHAQVLAARSDQAQAVAYLRGQLALFAATSLRERIQKNINLLSLEGKPAPPLVDGPPFAGHPVLLFFWAHWCPDCKAEVPVLAEIQKVYSPKGLLLIGPTRLYGYAAGGEDAAPPVERQYIERVRRQYYSALPDMPVPVNAANFQAYGASTTPTLVLIDSSGLVRFYHPGAVGKSELAARIQALLGR